VLAFNVDLKIAFSAPSRRSAAGDPNNAGAGRGQGPGSGGRSFVAPWTHRGDPA
jgi:hypothetical protein